MEDTLFSHCVDALLGRLASLVHVRAEAKAKKRGSDVMTGTPRPGNRGIQGNTNWES